MRPPEQRRWLLYRGDEIGTDCISERAAQPSDRGGDFFLLKFFRQRFGRGEHAMQAIGSSREEIIIAAFADNRRERQLPFAARAFLGCGYPLPFENPAIACDARRLERLEAIAQLFSFQEPAGEKNHNHRDRGKRKNIKTPVQHNYLPSVNLFGRLPTKC